MKQYFSFTVLLCALFSLNSSRLKAEIYEQDDVAFTYTVTDGGVTISRIVASGRLEIPSEINGFPVRVIEREAAADQSSVVDLLVPTNVTSIGLGAFKGCTSITNMVLPFVGASRGTQDSLFLGHVFGATEANKASSYVPESVKSVSITDDTVIGPYAFYYCTNIEEVKISNSVQAIESYALGSGMRLRKLVIPFAGRKRGGADGKFASIFGGGSAKGYVPKSLTDVEITDDTFLARSAFYECDSLETIKVSAISLGNNSFEKCTSLTNIVLSGQISNIGDSAFLGCTGLKEFFAPEAVTNIGSHAFQNCSSLTNTTFPASSCSLGEYAYYGTALSNVYIPGSVTNIGSYAFYRLKTLGEVILSQGVQSIQSYAFSQCINLSTIKIPGSVDSIGVHAFAGCSSLSNVLIEEGLRYLDKYVFSDCVSLKEITFPRSLLSMEGYVLYGCSNLESLSVPFIGSKRGVSQLYVWFSDSRSVPATLRRVAVTDETELVSYAFSGCGSLESIKLNEGIVSIGNEAFKGFYGLSHIRLPSSVRSLGESAFRECRNLEEVNIPPALEVIPARAFESCSSLTAITIPSNIVRISSYAFAGCLSLERLEFEEGVSLIEERAFENCGRLLSIQVPKSVTRIDQGAFSKCESVRDLEIPFVGARRGVDGNPDEGVLGYIFGSGGTNQVNQRYGSGGTVYIKAYSLPSALKKVIITDDIDVPLGAFSNIKSLEEVYINEGVSSIGGYAFYGCQNLKSFKIPSSATLLGGSAFYHCDSLSQLDIPVGVKVLGPSVAMSCTGLKEVIIAGATSIEDNAFSSCTNLSSVVLPSSVVSIGTGVFSGCSAITNIVIPSCISSVKTTFPSAYSSLTKAALAPGSVSLFDSTFSHCTMLESVYIPSSVSSVGSYAFSYCASLRSVSYGGDAPSVSDDIYFGTPRLLVTYVNDGTIGWNGGVSTTLPSDGLWPIGQEDNRAIRYMDGGGCPSTPGDENSGPSAATIEIIGGSSTNVVIETMSGADAYGLPNGLSWDPATGTVSGAPLVAGTYVFFLVKDGKVQRYSVKVDAPPAPMERYELVAGVSTNIVIGGVLGCDVYALPEGLVWDKSTGVLSGAAKGAVTNTVYFVTGFGESTEVKTTILAISAERTSDGQGNDTDDPGRDPGTSGDESGPGEPGNDHEIPGANPDNPGEHPGPGVKDNFTVAVSVDCAMGSKGVVSASARTVAKGHSVELVAKTASANSYFAYWKEGNGAIVGYTAKLTVSPEADAEYIAVFRTKASCAAPTFDPGALSSVVTQAMVGVQFKTQIEINPDAYPVRFTASKLPNGLRINATTGEIYGVPTKTGHFTAVIKAVSKANASKSASAQVKITVVALPAWAQGNFYGELEGAAEDGDLHGAARLTVSSCGKISGKIVEHGTNFTFNVNGFDKASVISDEGTNLIVSVLAKAGKMSKDLNLSFVNSLAEGSMGDSTVRLERSPWKDVGLASRLANFKGAYTVQLVSDGSFGHGYLSVTVATSGFAKAVGKLADGTSVSVSVPLFWDELIGAPYGVLCISPSGYAGGYAYEIIRFNSDRTLNGFDGVVLNLSKTATVDYGSGYFYEFASRGAWYSKLADLKKYYLSLTFSADAPDLSVAVKETDISDSGKTVTTSVTEWQSAVDMVCWDSLTVTLNAKGTAFVVPKATKPTQNKTTKEWSYKGVNDASLKFTFNKATGIFSGSFVTWYDYVSARDYVKGTETISHKSKTSKFVGIAVQGDPTLRGYYLWPANGAYEDSKTGKLKSYKVNESYAVEFR